MGCRYGGPMLNTAATRIYWKHETKNSAEFSKFWAASLSPPSSGPFSTGGVYLNKTSGIYTLEIYQFTYQLCERTQKYAQNCTALVMTTCPIILQSTFLDTRLAVGPLGKMRGYGSVRPTKDKISLCVYTPARRLTCNGNWYDDEEVDVQELGQTLSTVIT